MKSQKFRNSRGISLIEVMISMMVMGIGVLGMAPMIVLSVESNTMSRENTRSAKLMKEKIEYYETLDPMPAIPFAETESGLDSIFTRTTSIADNTSDTLIPAGLYRIAVRIDWLDNQSVQQSRNFSTYIVK